MSDSPTLVHFVIPGKPVGKGRPRVTTHGTYTPRVSVLYENWVKTCAEKAMDGLPILEGPINISVRIFIQIPRSWSKKKTNQAINWKLLPATRPDIDNIVKSITDACNGLVYVDDRQIVDIQVSKRYAMNPQVIVNVMEIEQLRELDNERLEKT